MLACLILLLLAAMWSYPVIWFRFINKSLDVHVRFNRHFAEIGDVIQLECTLSNRSRMPCPSFTLSITLPDGLASVEQPDVPLLRLHTALRGRETITCTAECTATARGYHGFELLPAILVLSEGFGLRELTAERGIKEGVSVFPRSQVSDEQRVQLTGIIGSLEVNRWIHPDESSLKGIRTYVPGDPFKQIAWNASASTGQWMVKQFSSTTDTRVHLVLNAQFHEVTWMGTRVDEFDGLCSMVESAARLLSSKGCQLFFSSNGMFPGSPMLHCHGQQTADSIRMLLARIGSQSNQDFADLWNETSGHLMPGDQVIVFTSYLSDRHQQMIDALSGRVDVAVVSSMGVHTHAAEPMGGVADGNTITAIR